VDDTGDMNQGLIDRLRERMDALGKRPRQVAEEAGVGPSFVHDILLGRSENPTTEKLDRVARVLGTSVGYLLHGDRRGMRPGSRPPRPGFVAVPFIKVEAGLGGGTVATDEERDEPWFFRRSWLRDALGARASELRLIGVKGDSMEPTLKSGDIIMLNIADRASTPPGIFVLFDGVGLVAKRLEPVPNSEPPRVRIISDNPRYDTYERTVEEITVVGRVVWFARAL
jgi:phage repressor protein C with HTH and peptisase S24 domain